MEFKEINPAIRTKITNRPLLIDQWKRQAFGDTKFKGLTEKTRYETEEVCKDLQKIKEDEERSRLTKEQLIKASRRMEDARMHDLDRVQKVNKELVAKLEEVEKDRKFAVESKIEVIKILDEEMKKVSFLDRVQKENKELVAKLEKVENDRKFAVKSRIELIKILDGLRKKVSCLEEKCVNLEKDKESQKIAYMEREITYKLKILEEKEKLEVEREKNQALLEEKVLIADEKLEKLEVEREELMERIASVEERFKKAVGMEADGVKNKVEIHKLVDGNTKEYEDTLFGNEDDTVYVDFDK